jgi:hypothetical protein
MQLITGPLAPLTAATCAAVSLPPNHTRSHTQTRTHPAPAPAPTPGHKPPCVVLVSRRPTAVAAFLVHCFVSSWQGVKVFQNTSVLCFSVLGYNFGGDFVVANMSLLRVTVAAVPCLEISEVTHKSLVCCSRVTSGLVYVTVAGQTSAATVLSNTVRPPPPWHAH